MRMRNNLRSSNEAVWGGNFEDPSGPKRGIRALRFGFIHSADRHTQSQDSRTHRRVCDYLSAWVYLNLGLIYTRYFVLSRIIYRE